MLISYLMIVILVQSGAATAQVSIRDVNPDFSTFSDANGGSGGRINHLGTAADESVIYAASERGGLFKSTDGGAHWPRIDTHLPTMVWDVKVSPIDSNRIFTTSFYDGRVRSLAGINISTDGGVTWTHPTTAIPPSGFCRNDIPRQEPSGFGISIDPSRPQTIYVGTNCGLAVSQDEGETWTYINPFQDLGLADNVWAVLAHDNGVVDICGDGGHRRSLDGGLTWTGPQQSLELPSGRCSLAVSPDEPNVLFAVAGTFIFESDDGGLTWSTRFQNPASQGRIPFVATSKLEEGRFNLWFGDISLYKADCISLSRQTPLTAPRCPPSDQWHGPYASETGAHDDVGDILFSVQPLPSCSARCTELHSSCLSDCPQVSCPSMFSSDGGVYLNQLASYPDCEAPLWRQPVVTPHSLWALASSAAAGYVYFSNQDNGVFVGKEQNPYSFIWLNKECCDSYDVAADSSFVVYTQCCFGDGRLTHLLVRRLGMAAVQVANYPDGDLFAQVETPTIAGIGDRSYVVLTTKGVFVTEDILGKPVRWQLLSAPPLQILPCGVWTSIRDKIPTLYVQGPFCSRSKPDQVWRHTGIASRGVWQRVKTPDGLSSFGIFAAHPKNPRRLFASFLSDRGPQMISSKNGGLTWIRDVSLDKLMIGHGVFKSVVSQGLSEFSGFASYVQPALVAFSPYSSGVILAAGRDSGVFFSVDDGMTWKTITDNSGGASRPVIPNPKVAAFSRNQKNIAVYLGSQGRGLWKITLRSAK